MNTSGVVHDRRRVNGLKFSPFDLTQPENSLTLIWGARTDGFFHIRFALISILRSMIGVIAMIAPSGAKGLEAEQIECEIECEILANVYAIPE